MYQNATTMLLLLAAAACPAVAQNPYTIAPKNYPLEFENESVRVSRAMFVPGDKLPVHDHPGNPTGFVCLTDGGPIRFTHVAPAFIVERPAVKEGAIRYHTGAKETRHLLGSAAPARARNDYNETNMVKLPRNASGAPTRVSVLAAVESGV